MLNKILTIALLSVALFLAGCKPDVVAKEGNAPSQIIRESVTIDENGKVTIEEVKRAPQSCINKSLAYIARYSPTGLGVYKKMKNKEDFEIWFDCNDTDPTMMIVFMTTAIHESVHFLTDTLGAYPLIGGGQVPMFDDQKLPPPHKVNHLFPKDDSLVEIYLTDGEETASSSDHFSFLLNEMNAYAFDLKSVIEFIPFAPNMKNHENSFREGTAAMMAFTAAYLNSLKNTSHWSHIMKNKSIITTLWNQSEKVYNDSCKFKFLGGSEKHFIKVLLAHQEGINMVLGRKVKLDC
jgi:hypothetical protein